MISADYTVLTENRVFDQELVRYYRIEKNKRCEVADSSSASIVTTYRFNLPECLMPTYWEMHGLCDEDISETLFNSSARMLILLMLYLGLDIQSSALQFKTPSRVTISTKKSIMGRILQKIMGSRPKSQDAPRKLHPSLKLPVHPCPGEAWDSLSHNICRVHFRKMLWNGIEVVPLKQHDQGLLEVVQVVPRSHYNQRFPSPPNFLTEQPEFMINSIVYVCNNNRFLLQRQR